jgi:mRNA interferase RelE/StbE
LTPNRYTIIFLRSARKELDSLDGQMTRRIAAAIDALADEPRPPGCIKVKSEDGDWRIRVGDYRIGYIIDDPAKTVTIVRIGNRSDFYD